MAKQWPDASSAGALESWAAAYKYDGLPFIFIRNLNPAVMSSPFAIVRSDISHLAEKNKNIVKNKAVLNLMLNKFVQAHRYMLFNTQSEKWKHIAGFKETITDQGLKTMFLTQQCYAQVFSTVLCSVLMRYIDISDKPGINQLAKEPLPVWMPKSICIDITKMKDMIKIL